MQKAGGKTCRQQEAGAKGIMLKKRCIGWLLGGGKSKESAEKANEKHK
jgi:hypothetical protein